QFKLSVQTYQSTVRAVKANETPAASPARALGRKLAGAFSGNSAIKVTNDWQEF
ncbi:glycerol uptake facilitator-like aquaporin, partial [Rhizobium cellulosilyticum]|nr:glycerol uptake facilitator-like aquaporin [Rhizobium cellulosilyticum]MBB4415041.1 glycerol uptake facilitator-like aquaporin [Rhizobium cellulosilyticum]MBB4449733.1 glycerol uptake facilitator-like aquaporin [Rhizobium cellulosilyticum]